MNERRLWTGCAVAGVLAFIASFLFGRIPGLVACGPTPHGLGPILAFEVVRSPADVMALFGAEPCRGLLVAAQRTGVLLDGLWFIPAYTAFLMLGALATHRRVGAFLAACALAAGISDEIEGVLLWAILRHLPGSQDQIEGLFWAVHIKFALLCWTTAFIGLSLATVRRPLPSKPVAAALILSGMLAAHALGSGHDVAAAMRWFTVGWTALLVAAIAAAVRPSLFAERDDLPSAPARPAA